MGFFSTLFGNSDRKSTSAVNQPETAPLKEIKESEFNNNLTTHSDDIPNTSISYGSSMPIDLIYQFLKEDYETKGYEDALCNQDNSYKEMNKLLKLDIKPVFGSTRPGDVKHSNADISKANDLLNYHPSVSFQEGLKRTKQRDWSLGCSLS